MESKKRITIVPEPVQDTPDDIFKSVEATPGDENTDRNVQVESVLRIIDESIRKLRISLILPNIFENPRLFRDCLKKSRFEPCADALDAYLHIKKSVLREPPPHRNFRVIKLIDMFLENYEMIKLLPNWISRCSLGDKAMLEGLDVLFKIAKERFRQTAVDELKKERKIHELYLENERIKTNIKSFQNKLKNQKISLRWKMAAKDVLIHKTEEDLAFKKWDNNLRIKEEIDKSAKRVQGIQTASLAKQKELEEELEKVKLQYEKAIKEFLQQEKDARDEKNKLLLQLQSLNKKYDQNIGDKMKENLYLKDFHERQKIEFEIFMARYSREEAIFQELVVNVREEEERRHEEEVEAFRQNRAVRVLQKYWRIYMKKLKARKKAEKSAKSPKGKKAGEAGKGEEGAKGKKKKKK
ncbi:inner centromere protein-like [Teleopsis dalmanni]|uniref:inner centromere protein-like n=1 Tax=Teleopsis dalmanni TaxID=139649 RepID=UPI0018CF8022|nr:inner centromere protein-like [Teleopsis dalmanni]